MAIDNCIAQDKTESICNILKWSNGVESQYIPAGGSYHGGKGGSLRARGERELEYHKVKIRPPPPPFMGENENISERRGAPGRVKKKESKRENNTSSYNR